MAGTHDGNMPVPLFSEIVVSLKKLFANIPSFALFSSVDSRLLIQTIFTIMIFIPKCIDLVTLRKVLVYLISNYIKKKLFIHVLTQCN